MPDAEAVKSSVKLADVVERYGVKLKPAVRGGKAGVCPLHRDTDPSFIVYDDGHYHCYGCAANGDVISFIQAVENTDFKGAVDILIRDFGADSTSAEDYRQIRAKQKLVYDWYASQLGALEDLADAYAELVKYYEATNQQDNYFDALSELFRLEGDFSDTRGAGGLIGECLSLGTHGDVLVALYDTHGVLPPVADAAGSFRFMVYARNIVFFKRRKSVDQYRCLSMAILCDPYILQLFPGEPIREEKLRQVIDICNRAEKVIDDSSTNSQRQRREGRDPGYYPSRRGSGRRNYQEPAA